jgi:hypothetical protein
VALWLLFRAVRFVAATGRWDIVQDNLRLLLTGRYPVEHLPRVAVSVVIAAGVGGLVAGIVHRHQVAAGTAPVYESRFDHARVLVRRLWPVGLGAVLLLGMSTSAGPYLTAIGTVAAAVLGRVVGARLPARADPVVIVAAVLTPFGILFYLADGAEWDGWGGIMLNVLLAVTSAILCFPVGVLGTSPSGSSSPRTSRPARSSGRSSSSRCSPARTSPRSCGAACSRCRPARRRRRRRSACARWRRRSSSCCPRRCAT